MTISVRLAAAARIVLGGGIVAYPTEAVYGLGCLPADGDAVARILRIKRRSWRKGLLLVAAETAALEPYVEIDESPFAAEIRASWPGPHTWILPARPGVPGWITGGRPSVGVRVTAHPIAADLARRSGGTVVSTSANVSRRPPARTALEARRVLGRQVDFVLAGAVGGEAKPTLIRDGMTGRVLRAA